MGCPRMAKESNSNGASDGPSDDSNIPVDDWRKATATVRGWCVNLRRNPVWRVRGAGGR